MFSKLNIFWVWFCGYTYLGRRPYLWRNIMSAQHVVRRGWDGGCEMVKRLGFGLINGFPPPIDFWTCWRNMPGYVSWLIVIVGSGRQRWSSLCLFHMRLKLFWVFLLVQLFWRILWFEMLHQMASSRLGVHMNWPWTCVSNLKEAVSLMMGW